LASSEEIAWAAGLFEGEGCVYISKRLTVGKLERATVSLVVSSTDLDVLERFFAVVNCGKILHESGSWSGKQPHWKDTYEWRTAKRDEVKELLYQFLPWLGSRRTEKAEEALKFLETPDLRHAGW
jgi:hypothetical protein